MTNHDPNKHPVLSAAFGEDEARQVDAQAVEAGVTRSSYIRSCVENELQKVSKAAGVIPPDRKVLRAALEATVAEEISKSGKPSRLTKAERDVGIEAGVEVLEENIARTAQLIARVQDLEYARGERNGR